MSEEGISWYLDYDITIEDLDGNGVVPDIILWKDILITIMN